MSDDLKRVGLVFKEEGAVDFRKTLQEVNIEMNKNYNQFKLTQSQWDKSTKSTEKLKAQQEYLGNTIEIQGDKVKVLRRQLEELENAENKDITAIKKKQNELTNAEIKLKNYENQLKDVTSQLNNSGKAWEENGKKLEKFGTNIQNAGKKMLGVTTGITALGTGAIATAANFEDAMRQVAATMGITADEIENGSESYKILEDAAKQCGENTKYSASEAAEALNYLALAGYDAKKSAEVLPKILNLATAGNLDLATASDMVTDAMAALGMETKDLDKYIDEMAKTSQKSNTSVGQLGEATLTCAGTVKLANMSLETMNAELGILANNGIKGAEGGTHLRNIILSLTSPTDVAAKALKNLGIKVTDSSGNIRDMNDIMADFNKKLAGMSDEKKTNIISQIFNKTDISAVNALIKGSGEEFANLKKEISNSNGAAQDMADTMNSSLKGQLTLVKSQLEAIAIKLGNKLMPYVKDCVKKISDLATKFSNLNDEQTKTVLKIAGIVAAAGPLLTIVGKITSLLGSGIKTIGVVNQAVGVMRGTITTTSTAVNGLVTVFKTINPITLIAATGITALSAAAYKYAENQNAAKKEAEEFTQKVTDSKQALDDYNKSIDDSINAEIGHIEYVSKLKDELIQLVDENGKVKKGYEGRVSFILNEMNQALGTEYELNGDVIDSYKNLREEIDKTIEKKRAEVLLSAGEEKYKNAIKTQTKAVEDLKQAHDDLGMSYEESKQKIENWKTSMNNAVSEKDTEKVSELSRQYKQELEALKERIKAYETAESTVKECNNNIKSYEDDYAKFAEGKYNEIGQTIIGSTKSWSESSLSEIRTSIENQKQELSAYKEIYERTGDEVARKAMERAQQNLQALANELVQRTSTIGELGEDEIKAWQTLATTSYSTYYDTISPLDEELRKKIEQMTGVTAEKTPELVAETQRMSEQVLAQIEQNSEFRQEAIKNLQGMLNGLEDNELRELLENAGVEDVEEVLKGIRKGNLAENEGVNILKSLHTGLGDARWKKNLWDTARGIASSLSGLLSIKANINRKTSSLPGHKSGLDYVPYDDYVARLHKGERVLTAKENKSLEEAQKSSKKSNLEFSSNSNNTNVVNIDYNKIANAFLTALNKCKLTLDEDGFARIVKDELYKVV